LKFPDFAAEKTACFFGRPVFNLLLGENDDDYGLSIFLSNFSFTIGKMVK